MSGMNALFIIESWGGCHGGVCGCQATLGGAKGSFGVGMLSTAWAAEKDMLLHGASGGGVSLRHMLRSAAFASAIISGATSAANIDIWMGVPVLAAMSTRSLESCSERLAEFASPCASAWALMLSSSVEEASLRIRVSARISNAVSDGVIWSGERVFGSPTGAGFLVGLVVALIARRRRRTRPNLGDAIGKPAKIGDARIMISPSSLVHASELTHVLTCDRSRKISTWRTIWSNVECARAGSA